MYTTVNALVSVLKRCIPESVVRHLRPFYHFVLAYGMALAYGFPARHLTVIGVTGTKGKSTTTEMLFTILRAAGYKTALLSTIRFAIEDSSEPNRYKMTLHGRGFAQAFMHKALQAGCTHLVIEVTSESVLQYRHLCLEMDGLIVTNIQKEHIERHGSFENYAAAKRTIAETLAHSSKPRRILVANNDQSETRAFLSLPVTQAIPFSESELAECTPGAHTVNFSYHGTRVELPLAGRFNALNALAAIKLCEAFGIDRDAAAQALHRLPPVRGRVERIDAGQPFTVIVDYAHTPDSLKALYAAFPERKICVLGNTGGGRDTWKRPEMGRIADEACAEVILTNEDPYDEDPRAIVEAMAKGMRRTPAIIMDRREAIATALRQAKEMTSIPSSLDSARDSRNEDVAVLISGKGTDPYIMGPKGSKTPWDDARVVREELERLLA